jgi:hypothetical protein
LQLLFCFVGAEVDVKEPSISTMLLNQEMEKANIKNQSIQFRLELELHQTREKLYQSREKMYQAALAFIVDV